MLARRLRPFWRLAFPFVLIALAAACKMAQAPTAELKEAEATAEPTAEMAPVAPIVPASVPGFDNYLTCLNGISPSPTRPLDTLSCLKDCRLVAASAISGSAQSAKRFAYGKAETLLMPRVFAQCAWGIVTFSLNAFDRTKTFQDIEFEVFDNTDFAYWRHADARLMGHVSFIKPASNAWPLKAQDVLLSENNRIDCDVCHSNAVDADKKPIPGAYGGQVMEAFEAENRYDAIDRKDFAAVCDKIATITEEDLQSVTIAEDDKVSYETKGLVTHREEVAALCRALLTNGSLAYGGIPSPPAPDFN